MPYKSKEDQARCSARAHARVRAVIQEAKSKPCVVCGHSFHYCVMDFDHVRGKKLFELAQSYARHGLAAILKEIAKCEVVCSNCHRVRTFQRKFGT